MKTIPLDCKTVEYAYPTSSNATRLGFGKTGCWCVELANRGNARPQHAVTGHANKEQAIKTAQALPHPWSPLFLRFNPEFAAKTYYIDQRAGRVKYWVRFHDGAQTHKDGSPFFDARTFRNKPTLAAFVADLESQGYSAA